MAFNRTDDEVFQNAVLSGGLGAANILRECLPSQLNLTSQCFFTAELFSGTLITRTFTQQVQQIAIGLKAALPSLYSNASYLDRVNYWNLLNSTLDTNATLYQAWQSCSDSRSFIVPRDTLNLTQNCVATATYFYTHQTPDRTELAEAALSSSALVNLTKSSLSGDWAKLSNYTLFIIGRSFLYNTDTFEELKAASQTCWPEYCQTLDYAGNADLAGVGVLISMFMIVVLASLFWFTILAERCQHKDSIHWLRTAAYYAAFSFWDSVIYIAIMTSIGASYYIAMTSKTVYETLVAVFISLIVSNAGLILVSLYSSSRAKEETRGEIFPRGLAHAGMVGALHSCPVLLIIQFSRLQTVGEVRIIDYACYQTRNWPMTLGWIAAIAGVAQFVTLVMAFIVLNYVPSRRWTYKRWNILEPGDKFSPMVGIREATSFISMWFNLVSLVAVRSNARILYGDSFADNAFGFGQVMATGFCLQAIVLFICKCLWRNGDTESTDNLTQPMTHTQMQDTASIYAASGESQNLVSATYLGLPTSAISPTSSRSTTPDIDIFARPETPSSTLSPPSGVRYRS